jgi:Na+-transporting NADH:ubiquinone oxidoreductase subunit C
VLSETDNANTVGASPASTGLQPNTVGGTLVVAIVMCLVCSLLVSAAAVALRPTISANKQLNRQRNVLVAAGLYDSEKNTVKDIPGLFEQVQSVAVQLPDRGGDTASAGQIVEMPAEPSTVPIPPELDLAGIKTRETVAEVYVINGSDGRPELFVLPVRGKGLWSTLYGYLALSADTEAGMPVRGITFYEHAETPGLGGEVDNPKWKAQWPGKELFDAEGEPQLRVTKQGNANDPNEVDGLSGATVTSNGVQGLVNYWLGPDGFGPFLDRYRQGELSLGGAPQAGPRQPVETDESLAGRS